MAAYSRYSVPMTPSDQAWMRESLPLVEQSLGYKFRDERLLLSALTHRSFCNESDTTAGHFDELEWLGDSVLQLAVSSWLFRTADVKQRSSGHLTTTRVLFVNTAACESFAHKLNLTPFLRTKQRALEKTKILADCFEAVLGAVYLDGECSDLGPVHHILSRVIPSYQFALGSRGPPPPRQQPPPPPPPPPCQHLSQRRQHPPQRHPVGAYHSHASQPWGPRPRISPPHSHPPYAGAGETQYLGGPPYASGGNGARRREPRPHMVPPHSNPSSASAGEGAVPRKLLNLAHRLTYIAKTGGAGGGGQAGARENVGQEPFAGQPNSTQPDRLEVLRDFAERLREFQQTTLRAGALSTSTAAFASVFGDDTKNFFEAILRDAEASKLLDGVLSGEAVLRKTFPRAPLGSERVVMEVVPIPPAQRRFCFVLMEALLTKVVRQENVEPHQAVLRLIESAPNGAETAQLLNMILVESTSSLVFTSHQRSVISQRLAGA